MSEKSHPLDVPKSGADLPARPPGAWIVVGVDGSESSIAAVRWGARLASALNVNLEVVAVWPYPAISPGSFYSSEVWPPENDADKILTDVIATVFGDDPPPSVRTITRPGPVAPALIKQSTGADMLIVGSRGRGGFVGLILGSVSATVAEHARCAVLVVHGDAAVTHAPEHTEET
ncbi:universal stress protein [Glaciibacter psychrotolerans]|uniref:Nucleotide-binding universal stress UspA family protein n=1 Tax=Glaciibacter psychrotolerans TaxID=670054 RepID=A0A7Z0ECH5_9MICO|nr:universal stress protein [Leifsonia psychrotolerans]NYJ18655.1 nucleotide-binding universal stress UspA family protein [Leifsonia psychrotolerans]